MTIVMKNLRKIPYGFEASLLMDIGQEFFIICYGFLWLRQQAANAYPYLIREKWKTKIPLSENSAEFFYPF